jgi:hypothetical protein
MFVCLKYCRFKSDTTPDTHNKDETIQIGHSVWVELCVLVNTVHVFHACPPSTCTRAYPISPLTWGLPASTLIFSQVALLHTRVLIFDPIYLVLVIVCNLKPAVAPYWTIN